MGQTRHRYSATPQGFSNAEQPESEQPTLFERVQQAAREASDTAEHEESPSTSIEELAEQAEQKRAELNESITAKADLTQIRGDLEQLVRDHPLEAVLISIGAGYLLARTAGR